MNGEHWCSLFFDNCRVPKNNLLLGPGGFKNLISGFNVERLGNSARSLALGKFAFNLAREHASVRRQFGRHLCEFQGLHGNLRSWPLKLESPNCCFTRGHSKDPAGLRYGYATRDGISSLNEAAITRRTSRFR